MLPVDKNLTRVGLIEPVQDAHQRRFTRAVFPNDTVDRARHHADGNVFIGLDRPEGLGNSDKFDGGRGFGHSTAPVPTNPGIMVSLPSALSEK